MLKTTIPTLEIKSSGVDLTSIQTIFISIKQRDFETTKSNEDIEVDDSVISVSLKKTEYEKFKNGDISISINAYGYDGNSYKIKTEWAKFGSRTSYEEGSGGGGTGYDILPTVESVKNNTESGKLVDALAVKEVFTSVSNGKSLIASAITGKGVQTDATDTFDTMATNIEKIESGGIGEFPINSPYHFVFNSNKIPFSTNSGYFDIPIFFNNLKKIVVKKMYFYMSKTNTTNSSGTVTFSIIGTNKEGVANRMIKQWFGSLAQNESSKIIYNITADTEINLDGYSSVDKIRINKGSVSGSIINVAVTINFEADLYF